jgi:hypothetical protein
MPASDPSATATGSSQSLAARAFALAGVEPPASGLQLRRGSAAFWESECKNRRVEIQNAACLNNALKRQHEIDNDTIQELRKDVRELKAQRHTLSTLLTAVMKPPDK